MAPAVQWRDGVQIAGTVIWCDARRARDLCFLSHAGRHLDRALRTRRLPAHGQLLTTARTLKLWFALSGVDLSVQREALVTPFSRPFSLGKLRLELFPSGKLPGAASLAIEMDGYRIVYAGEINPSPNVAEPMQIRGADVVILDAPLAAQSHTLSSPERMRAQLVATTERALARGTIPVLLAATLWGSAEVVHSLHAAGIPLLAHPRIAATIAAYRTLGISIPPPQPLSLHRRVFPRDAVIWPLELRDSLPWRDTHRIAATALAVDPQARQRLGVDEAVPIGDQADLAMVVDYVKATGAREVYLTAGYSEETARAFGRRRRVAPLGPPRQMGLF